MEFIELLISLLPIIIFSALFIFIIRKFGGNAFNFKNAVNQQKDLIDTLKEIRDELKELNKNNSEKKL